MRLIAIARTATSAMVAALLAPVLAVGMLAPAASAAPASATGAAAPRTAGAPAAPAEPVPLTIIAPLTARPDADGLLGANLLTAYTSPLGVLTRQLDELIASGAVIAVDPMVLASIRVLGAEAPESALRWLARLESAPNETVLLAYADADLGVLARIGRLDAATPLGFDAAIDPAAFGPAETTTPAPTTTPDDEGSQDTTPGPDPAETGEPGLPPLPTTADLLAWEPTVTGVAWPLAGGTTTDELDALSAAGFAHVVLGSAEVAPSTNAHVDIDGHDAVVVDDGIGDLVRTALDAADPAAFDAAIALVQDALRGHGATDPGSSVAIGLDRRWPLGAYRLADVVAAIGASGVARSSGIAELLASPSTGAELATAEGDAARDDLIRSLLDAETAETAFATVLDDPALLTAPRRLELLRLVSAGWRPDEQAWASQTADFLARSSELLGAVQVVEGSDVGVISTSTTLPVAVRNALPYPVTVVVSARPLRPLLRVTDAVEATIEPDSSKIVRIPAEAVTNGRVTVRISLTSPAGVAVGTPSLLHAELQAQWETVGIVAGIVVILVFLGGVVRSVLKRRRLRRREDPERGSAAEPRSGPDPEPDPEPDPDAQPEPDPDADPPAEHG